MNENYELHQVVKNSDKSRFELEIDGYIAFIDYKQKDQLIKLIHTEVPEELGGRGVAATLVEKTLVYLENNNFTLYPYCPYVYAYIKKHPDWKRIVDTTFPKYGEL
ncbi:GNAT family N-acetyltransferase [Faecalibacter rhinopitheci]|uniref:N-acetyltransferase n=1 Tax=Faecalibacter rhinopitheci TaxID=2779678 RepID=A0A8J7FRF4_9FLAO|nr:GNAT family N-acetyltransferase [Faecalibacter rhinopitheci]MBF0597133.1 N-acetyltransferase [Faecalibacter rhinopitheci]